MAHVHVLKRFGAYTVLAAFLLYFFYAWSFPAQPPNNIATGDANAEKPAVPEWLTHHEEPPKEKPQQEQPQVTKPQEEPSTKPSEKGDGDAHKDVQNEPPKPDVFDWATVPKKYPVKNMVALPTGAPIRLPRIQHDFSEGEEDATAKNIRETRQSEVKKQFLKCWKSYRGKAWMHDELRPISGGSKDGFGGWAATLIDTMDTLWIMGLKEEFNSAITDIMKIDFGNTTLEEVNLFETNIRHLGGLLSAYELSGEKRLLAKAKEVGEMLYHAFDTPNHMPVVSCICTMCPDLNLS
jgi:mannosyl-oligosaccharide alpha-1,2-mannosidase